jgi:hypothetical protein
VDLKTQDRLTVLACSNAAGTHKARLLVTDKSRNPRALEGVRVLTVTYTASMWAWITRQNLPGLVWKSLCSQGLGTLHISRTSQWCQDYVNFR